MSRYQKGKTNLDFTKARDSEWQWRQLGHMQVCTSLQTDNHASTPPLSFLQARCPSCRRTNSVKALKAHYTGHTATVISPPPNMEPSIVTTASVCLCACLSVRDHIFGSTRPISTRLFCTLSTAVARSSSGGVVICYVLPVLWMTSYLLASQGCSASTRSLGLGYKLCAVIPGAGQRTHWTTFCRLK